MKKLIFIGICLLTFFVYWFKISIDKWNKDAIIYNTEVKNFCPCEKWKYITKGQWECKCKKDIDEAYNSDK